MSQRYQEKADTLIHLSKTILYLNMALTFLFYFFTSIWEIWKEFNLYFIIIFTFYISVCFTYHVILRHNEAILTKGRRKKPKAFLWSTTTSTIVTIIITIKLTSGIDSSYKYIGLILLIITLYLIGNSLFKKHLLPEFKKGWDHYKEEQLHSRQFEQAWQQSKLND